MYLSLLRFNYVCFILIKYFMYFRGIRVIFTMNKRSNSKTDITFELRTVENLKRRIKGKMTLFTCVAQFTLQYCLHYCLRHYSHRRIDDVALTDNVALTDEVSWFYWIKILMYCWSVTWQHISGPKIVRTVHAYTQDILQQTALLFKPCGQTAYYWLMTCRNPERPKYS